MSKGWGQMAFLRSTLESETYGSFIFLCLLLSALTACGDNPNVDVDTRNNVANEVGAIYFSVILEDDSNDNSDSMRFLCGNQNDEVASVVAQITNGEHTIQPDEAWDCWSGRGVISGVPVGSNYTLTIIGQNASGETTYCAERIGIMVNTGDNNVGEIIAAQFESSGLEPLNGASDINSGSITFRWEGTSGATSYMLLISESSDLSNTIIDPPPLIGGQTYTITADDGLTPDTQYWWVVVPASFDGAFGYPFPEKVNTFTTSQEVTPPDEKYDVEYASIMYRRYESGLERYQVSIGISDNGSPCADTDVVGWMLIDDLGNEISFTDNSFYADTYMWFDCSSVSCSQDGPLDDTGVWAHYGNLQADSYTVEIEMENGQVLNTARSFSGQLNLPFVPSDSLVARWNGGDLELSWANPTTDSNWEAVDQLRIVIFDDLGNSVIYIRPATTDTSVTIPSALLTQATTLQDGNRLDSWQIQTRSYDPNGMNYSRAYSNTIALPAPEYEIDYVSISYNRYESGDMHYQTYLSIAGSGGSAISQTEVTDVEMVNSWGTRLVPDQDGFWFDYQYWYNCTTGNCAQSGPLEDSGYWYRFDSLSADTYTFNVSMENGETLAASRVYTGVLALPYVSSISMSAQYNGGDLQLNWSNPTADANWRAVDQLRIIISDNLGNAVLLLRPETTDTSITIPAALVTQASRIGGGDSLASWRVQTRANDSNGMTFARAYSHDIALP